jgi:hypothetical protein
MHDAPKRSFHARTQGTSLQVFQALSRLFPQRCIADSRKGLIPAPEAMINPPRQFAMAVSLQQQAQSQQFPGERIGLSFSSQRVKLREVPSGFRFQQLVLFGR